MSDKEYPALRKGSPHSPQGVLPGTPSFFDNSHRSRRRFWPASRIQRNKCNRMQHEIEKTSPCNDLCGGEPWQGQRGSNHVGRTQRSPTQFTKTATARQRSGTVAPPSHITKRISPTTQCQAKPQLILATITKKKIIKTSDFNDWFRVAHFAWPPLHAQKRPVLHNLAQRKHARIRTAYRQQGQCPDPEQKRGHALIGCTAGQISLHATLAQYPPRRARHKGVELIHATTRCPAVSPPRGPPGYLGGRGRPNPATAPEPGRRGEHPRYPCDFPQQGQSGAGAGGHPRPSRTRNRRSAQGRFPALDRKSGV